MSTKNRSATELARVLLEDTGHGGTYVWLRKNIRTVEETGEDGLPQTAWEADEVSGMLPYTITQTDAEGRFEELWAQLEDLDTEVSLPSVKKEIDAVSNAVTEVTALADCIADGLADLSAIVNDESETYQTNADAIAELSEIVSSLLGGD